MREKRAALPERVEFSTLRPSVGGMPVLGLSDETLSELTFEPRGAFMVTGVAYAVLATPVYMANALVQVEPKKNDMLGFSDLNSMLGGQSPSVTEIGIIKSRAVIGKTVDDLRLEDLDIRIEERDVRGDAA